MATNRVTTLFDFKSNGGLSKIKAEVKEADGLFGKAKAGIKGFTEELKTNRTAQAAVGTAAVAAAKVAIDAASNLGESINAVGAAYGEAGEDVLALGDNSVEAYGLSQRAFNELAVGFSAFAQQIAGDGGDVAATVDDLATRAADFASVMNIDVADAASRFRSALSGEAEPLKQYGINISAAATELYALENGLVNSKSEMTEAIKIQARHGLVMQETAKYAGDWAKTQDQLAGQQKQMSANLEDSAAKMGQHLIPAVEDAARKFNKFMEAAEEVNAYLEKLPEPAEKAGSSLFNSFVRAINPLENLEYAYDGLMESVSDGEKQTSAWVDEVVRVVKAVSDASAANTDYTKAQDLVNESIDEATEAADRAEKAHRGLGDANEYVAGLVDRHNRVVDEQADAYWEAKRAVEGQSQAIDDLIGKQSTLVGGDIAVRNSQREAAAAMREFNADAEDQQAEIDGVVEKQLAAAQAAADHRVQQLEASGEMVNSRQKAQIFADELGNLAGSLQGPVLEAVLRYIDELNRIPRNISSQVTFSVSGAKVTAGGDFIGSPTGFGGRRAMGGPVSGGRLYEVGEGGKPELFEQNGRQYLIPGNSGKVTPADQGGGSGVGDIHLHFDARGAIGMNEQQVQRWIVESLRRHVRFNGSIRGVTG